MDYLFKYRKCTSYSFEDLFHSSTTFVTLNHFNDAMEGYIPFSAQAVYERLSKYNKRGFYRTLIGNECKKITIGEPSPNLFSTLPLAQQIEIVSSAKYKQKALDFINDFAYALFAELRNSFMASSFSESGGHPVMWSHYSDDSSGFVGKYDANLLSQNLLAYLRYEYPALNNLQSKALGLHKITYGVETDCTKMICHFLVHRCNPGHSGINRFLQYINQTGDYQSVLYILTNKMKEWEYEKEWRLIIPKMIITRKKISKENAKDLLSDYQSLGVCDPVSIIAGENIRKEHLAALAYFCQGLSKGNVSLYLQKRDFDMVKRNIMKADPFTERALK